MNLLELALIVATLLCAVMAGFVFPFASVVMPGIGNLTDKSSHYTLRDSQIFPSDGY